MSCSLHSNAVKLFEYVYVESIRVSALCVDDACEYLSSWYLFVVTVSPEMNILVHLLAHACDGFIVHVC